MIYSIAKGYDDVFWQSVGVEEKPVDDNIIECYTGLAIDGSSIAGGCLFVRREDDARARIRLKYIYLKPEYRKKGESRRMICGFSEQLFRIGKRTMAYCGNIPDEVMIALGFGLSKQELASQTLVFSDCEQKALYRFALEYPEYTAAPEETYVLENNRHSLALRGKDNMSFLDVSFDGNECGNIEFLSPEVKGRMDVFRKLLLAFLKKTEEQKNRKLAISTDEREIEEFLVRQFDATYADNQKSWILELASAF